MSSRKYILLVACCTLWATACFIVPDFIDNPIDSAGSFFSIAAYIGALGIFQLLLVYLMLLWRKVCAVVLPLYALIGSAVSFYRVAYRVTITPMIVEATLQTNAEEAMGVLSPQLFLWVFLNLIIAIAFCFWRWRMDFPFSKAPLHAITAIALFAALYWGNDRLHRSANQRYPFNVVVSTADYIHLRNLMQAERTMPQYNTASVPDTLDIVLVIGESMRADHLSINGYERPTTPRLEKRNNLISLPHIYSEHTHTAASVPHILTRADSTNHASTYEETSFISIFKQEGFRTAWLSNQDLGEAFAPFIGECDTMVFANSGKTVFVFSEWTDGQLLPIVAQMQEERHSKNLYIIHTIGSHWYYNNHVPQEFQKFQPITSNRVVTSNTAEQVVNSYDNTALYLDFFLDSLISLFSDRNALIVYQSDHGESLGEDNHWLHAGGAEETKYPAAMIWYSDRYAQENAEKVDALKSNAFRHYRTDYIFHSILHAANLEAAEKGADVFEK
ncbi:MAG: lipid A phosphoethanolamine transferase [Paludibacteraceae bacterium]|nr:lipid A phosphoethanolamine transferase [Paludibacteraceae bacterium]